MEVRNVFGVEFGTQEVPANFVPLCTLLVRNSTYRSESHGTIYSGMIELGKNSSKAGNAAEGILLNAQRTEAKAQFAALIDFIRSGIAQRKITTCTVDGTSYDVGYAATKDPKIINCTFSATAVSDVLSGDVEEAVDSF